MGKCKFCGEDAGISKYAHFKCGARDTGIRRIITLVSEAVGRDLKDLESQINMIARGHYISYDELPSLKLNGWEDALFQANMNGDLGENTIDELALLATALSLTKTDSESMRKFVITKSRQLRRRASAVIKSKREAKESERRHHLQDQQKAERQRKIQEEADELQRLIQEEAELQRQLQEKKQAENQRESEDREAERKGEPKSKKLTVNAHFKCRNSIANAKIYRNVVERQRNLHEGEAEQKRRLEQVESAKQSRWLQEQEALHWERRIAEAKQETEETRRRRAEKEAVITAIERGRITRSNMPVEMTPFIMLKSETLVRVFQLTDYLQEQVVRKRQYYSGRETPTQYAMRLVDCGMLGVTTKHIYFVGDRQRFRIRYDHIVAFKEYTDGVGLDRAAQDSIHQKFATGDGWFTYNLVTALARRYSQSELLT